MAKKKPTATAAVAAPMLPAPDGQPFRADSVLTCDGCGMDVAVSFGGWRNLDAHKKSKEHAAAIPRRDKLPAVKQLKNGNISTFFKAPKQSGTRIPAPPKLGARKAEEPSAGPSSRQATSLLDSEGICVASSTTTASEPTRPADCSLIVELRAAISGLPVSVPLATKDDILFNYAQPPQLVPMADQEDVWIQINSMLDRDIGYNKSPEQLLPILRRGPLGLDGLANYLNACIVTLHLDAVLFEMRTRRIIEAIQLLIGRAEQVPQSPRTSSTPAAAVTASAIPAPVTTASANPTSTTIASTTSNSAIPATATPVSASPASATPVSATPASATPVSATPASALVIDLTSDDDVALPAVPPNSSPPASLSLPTRMPCLGYPVALPDDLPAGQCYEWGAETSAVGSSVAWRGNVFENKLYVQAKRCLGFNAASSPCNDCQTVFPTTSVQNLIQRILNGVHENTSNLHLSWRNMREKNDRLLRENNSRKLDALTLARKLTRVTDKLDTHKRLVYAIADSDVPRVQVVISVALRNKRGAHGVLQQLKRAQDRVYKPHSYTDDDYSLANLILRLGGDAALGVASRACGLPTRSTVHRHSSIPPLLISHGYPTLADVSTNIDSVFPTAVSAPSHGTKVGMVLMIDETKLEERLRWDPKTNAIAGTCREHSGHLDLIFKSMDQAHAVADALRSKEVHFATEMTVAALGLLVPGSREQVARPIQISGSCKREAAEEHAGLINTLVEAATTHAKLQNARVLCIATDGDAKRGSALVPITLSHMLSPSSPIYVILGRLPLFNLLCGKLELTLDKDYKHLFKRYRGMLLRPQGIDVFGFVITADMVKRHLLDHGLEPAHVKSLIDVSDTPSEQTIATARKHLQCSGMTPSHIDALMNPNDKQDVVLAFSLLVAVMKLPEPDPTVHNERYSQVRRRLNFLGSLFGYLLKPYTTLSMSLSQQMRSLSTAMFMLLALYQVYRGVPVNRRPDSAASRG